MKVFSAEHVMLTALTVAILTLTAPAVWGQTTSFGAYDPRQAEVLWNEATRLQNTGQHLEAVEKLKRAGHISRINEGLNARSQLPYLRAEIASLRALDELATADERQVYLSRIEAATIPSGPEKVDALLAQAEWHQYALLQSIDETEESTLRMARVWNFFRRALNEAIATYGTGSVKLLPALEGMVRAQYLLAAHRGVGAAMPGQMDRDKRNQAAGKSSFKRGLPVMVAIQALNRDTLGGSRETQADDLIRMGDWAWWTGNRRAALDYYNDALALANGAVVASDDADADTDTDIDMTFADKSKKEPDVDVAVAGSSLGALALANAEPVQALAAGLQEPHQDSVDNESGTRTLAAGAALATQTADKESHQSHLQTDLHPKFRILDRPVPLPAVPGLDPVLAIKQDQPNERDLIVSFNVSANGKAVNVEVIQGPEAENSRGPERVIRRLRKMRFRPVFKDGVPAESDTITWAVEASQWGSSQPANVTSSGGSNAT